MSAGTVTPYRSRMRAGRDGFPQLLHAELTKFRTVRGWLISMVVTALVIVLMGLLAASLTHSSGCVGPSGPVCVASPVGPDGEWVNDQFYFAHQPLDGNGSITVRLTSMTGLITYPPPNHDAIVPGVVPWAKAGVIIKEGTAPGSAYAAMMVTGGNGVRMQYDYTHDTAGSPGVVSAASPRWLRLTRSGDTLTGYESSDGAHWTRVGSAHLAGLPTTVQVGLFVTSPGNVEVTPGIAGGFAGRLTQATAVFDHVSLQGSGARGAWSRDNLGHNPRGPVLAQGGFAESGGTLTVSGSGDIGPKTGNRGMERTLWGTFAGLIVVTVMATMFVTAEYRHSMIRTTMAASPRRVRVLAAKAVVIGVVAFVTGLAAAAVAVPLGEWMLRANGNDIFPVTSLTELRVVAGTGALLAVTAVMAVAIGTVLRRAAAAVTAVLLAIVLPYILATASPLPVDGSDWLLRVTPAAAFAVQQSQTQYPQVMAAYTPLAGYYPLAPLAGFAVLCAYAALALAVAALLLRRRDA
jgi:hypothetical protein